VWRPAINLVFSAKNSSLSLRERVRVRGSNGGVVARSLAMSLNFDPLIPAPSTVLRAGFSRREKGQESIAAILL
jgi:hypothetical protein